MRRTAVQQLVCKFFCVNERRYVVCGHRCAPQYIKLCDDVRDDDAEDDDVEDDDDDDDCDADDYD